MVPEWLKKLIKICENLHISPKIFSENTKSTTNNTINIEKLNVQVVLLTEGEHYKKELDDQSNVEIGINKNRLDAKQEKLLSEAIPDLLKNAGASTVSDGFKKKVRNYQQVTQQEQYKREMKFLEGKVPSEDIIILKSAYVLKHLHESGESTKDLKEGIIRRFGTRGCNISNLCTAGYFSTHIIPLYIELENMYKNPVPKFNEIYEDIVKLASFAVFVNQYEKESDVVKAVEKRKNYGIKQINIHGIGKRNIKTVRLAIRKLRDKGVEFTATEKKQKGVIVVKIKFPEIVADVV